MELSAMFTVILLLPTLVSAQTCSYGGRTYNDQQIFNHENGCAKFQCQNGKIVATYEACPNDVDGKCHFPGSQFEFKGVFYGCTKKIVNDLPVYVNQALPPVKPPVCFAGGNKYENYDTFVLSDGCRTNQCQNTEVVVLTPAACGKNFDGNCHQVNTWTAKDGKVYTCRILTDFGKTKYDYTEVIPEPDLSLTCRYNKVKYGALEYFKSEDNCVKFQCQNGQAVALNEVCRFKETGDCYTINTQWKYQDKVYECIKLPDGTKKIRPVSLTSCYANDRPYNHLAKLVSDNGCTTSQCLNGRFVVIYDSCRDRQGNCQPNNTIWEDNGDLFQCIEKDPWGLTVVRYVEDEPEPIPVCENPGKDVVYLLDNSGSITAPNFEIQKNFTASFTRRFFIGTNASNNEFEFGGISFDTTVKKEFDLNTYTTQSSIFTALLGIKYAAGWTKTHLAFDYIVDNNVFDKGRSDAGNYVILITDGESNDKPATQVAAKRVRDKGIQIISVGVGSVNMQELQGVSADPDNVFTAAGYDVLKKVEERVSYRVCVVPPTV